MKMLKRIICIAVTAAVLIGLMPLANNVKADEEYFCDVYCKYVNENLQLVEEKIARVPITDETTWGELKDIINVANLPGADNRGTVNFVEWETSNRGQKSCGDDDIMMNQSAINEFERYSGNCPKLYYIAKYDKVFLTIWNCGGLFVDNSITWDEALETANNNIYSFFDIGTLENPVFSFDGDYIGHSRDGDLVYNYHNDIITISSDGCGTMIDMWSGNERCDVYSLHVKLSADNDFLLVVTDVYGGVECDRSSREGEKLYKLAQGAVYPVAFEDGDTYRDLLDKVEAPNIITLTRNPMGTERYEFSRWVLRNDSENKEGDVISNNSGEELSVVPLWNYMRVYTTYVNNASFKDSYRFNRVNNAWQDRTTYGATEINGVLGANSVIYVPTDKPFTYASLLSYHKSSGFWDGKTYYKIPDILNGLHSGGMDSIMIDIDEMYPDMNLAIDLTGYENYPSSTNNGGNTNNKGGDNGSSKNNENSGAIDTTAEDKEITEGIIEKLDEVIPTASDNSKQSITVDMQREDGSYDTTISSDVLEKLQGKNVDVTFDMGGYSWTINGKNITAENLKDINLEVNVESKSIPVTVYNKLEKAFETVGYSAIKQLSLAYDGDFGFAASLNINLGTDYFGKVGSLFFYSWDGSVQFMNSSNIDADGNAQFLFTHASDYAIVISDASAAPDTGDHSNIGLYTLLSVIAAAGITSTIIYKKKAFER